MSNLKEASLAFLKTKAAKRAGWTILSSCIGMLVAYIGYLAGTGVAGAIIILPVITGISNTITKELNNKYGSIKSQE